VALDVSAAPEPEDVQFENLEFGLLARLSRLAYTNASERTGPERRSHAL
jgi:hypothetical protein